MRFPKNIPVRIWVLAAALIFLAVEAVLSLRRHMLSPIQAGTAYWQKPFTCRGPDFREPLPDPDSAVDEPRSIFKMSNQVVLAIPRHYLGGPWDEHLPGTIASCRSISDLPQIQHLAIRIKGQWSGVFNERELPKDNNGQVEHPDQIRLHVLPPEHARPSWAAQKPVWNRAFISNFNGPPVTEKSGILCGGNSCWFPVPGEDDLYGSFTLLGGGSKELNLTVVKMDGVPYRGLDISGGVMLGDVYETLPAVILSIRDHLDRWNIVRPKKMENR
jgi:hypothetical protein